MVPSHSPVTSFGKLDLSFNFFSYFDAGRELSIYLQLIFQHIDKSI